MRIDLEKYASDHREKLDAENPPFGLWEGIEREITPSKKQFNWIWKAATITLLAICGLLIYQLDQQNANRLYSLGDISEEYRKIEEGYKANIAALEASLPKEELSSDDFAWVLEELKYLDKVNERFRRDIRDNPTDPRLIEALIDYYEKKLKLLRILELEINKRNNEKNRDIRL